MTLARRGASEALATALLLATIIGSNPAVTLGRAASDTFAGIRPDDVIGFIGAQILGALAAVAFHAWIYRTSGRKAS